jgi:hypothetical protein
MANAPEGIVLGRHRDLQGRKHQVWVRRGILAVIGIVPLLGLFNVFGQRPTDTQAAGQAATLSLSAPQRARGGLLYQAHFTIEAHRDLENAALILHPDWLQGMTLNTLEPSPTEETSENGAVRLEFGPIASGNRFDVFLQYQVNPTAVGSRKQWVELVDGQTRVASIQRGLFLFP